MPGEDPGGFLEGWRRRRAKPTWRAVSSEAARHTPRPGRGSWPGSDPATATQPRSQSVAECLAPGALRTAVRNSSRRSRVGWDTAATSSWRCAAFSPALLVVRLQLGFTSQFAAW